MFENDFIKKIKPYKLSSHNAWDYFYEDNVLKLDWNEAVISPSPLVYKNIKKILRNGKLNWYPNTHNLKLINLIANYNNVKKENVQYFASSDALHEYIVKAFITINDEVTIVGPTYDNFRAVAESNGAMLKNYNLDENFQLNIVDFNNYISKNKPKVIYIVNPNNPTGTIYAKKKLIDLISKNPKTLFIVDEAYFEFTKITLASYVDKFNNLLISRTFSKAFALASFRIGYVISNPVNIKVLNSIRNSKNVSLMAQSAAESVLEDFDYTNKYIDEVLKAKNMFEKSLQVFKWLQIFYGQGNFTFIKIKNLKIKKLLIEFLENNKVFIRDYGHLKTTEKYVRVTIGTIENMKSVISLISKFDRKIVNTKS